MPNDLYYLLTALPALPATPGLPVQAEKAIEMIGEHSSTISNALFALLSSEREIFNCGFRFFANEEKDYKPQLPSALPESFVETFMTYSNSKEAEWLTAVFKAWVDLALEQASKAGSSFLRQWALWEYSLRLTLLGERSKNALKTQNDSAALLPYSLKSLSELPDVSSVVNDWRAISEPLKAEMFLDQARIAFLRANPASFTFTSDELVAYILELRIHERYARFNPDAGRKILEEVTSL